MEDKLKQAREIIDTVDQKMAALFVERMNAVKTVAQHKMELGIPVYDASREEEVISKNRSLVEEDELRPFYVNFLQDVMTISRNYQRKLTAGMRISYSGIKGAFAYFAANRLFPEAEKISCANFAEAYNQVVNGDCDACVLPLENSSAGEVGDVTDLLFSGNLFITETIELSVSHNLMGVPGAALSDIREVVSHPQALAQSRKFIAKHGWKEVTFENTAMAAQYVAKQQDKHIAAIGSADSASTYGLSILASGINDFAGNTTRFAVLSRSANRSAAEKHGAHFALMFTVKNEAGYLARALNIIGSYGFNMNVLRSRPRKDLLWQYAFYVEAEGNIYSADGSSMLESLQVCCDKLKVLGSFIRYADTPN